MSLLKSPQELNENIGPSVVLISGPPAVGKSTLAYSAPNPFVLDGDNSYKRVMSAKHQCPALVIKDWKDVEKIANSKDIDGFETCIVDPFGVFVGYCLDHVKTLEGMSHGTKFWPETALRVQSVIRRIQAKGMHFVGIVHTKETERNNKVQVKQVSSGGSLDMIGYLADISGMLYINAEGERIFCVYPHAEFEFPAKGGAILGKDEIVIPKADPNVKPDFFQRLLLDPYYAFHKRKAEDAARFDEAYDKLCESATRILAVVSDTESMDVAYRELSALPVIGNSKQVWQEQIREMCGILGWAYNKTTKKFEVKI